MFMCHIIGIEPQFENIISNGPYIPMAAGQRKTEIQWTPDERKAANLDQRLKSLIMFVLPYDQMNSVIKCLTTKSTWDDMDFQDTPNDEEDARSSQEYMNNLEEEYQARALLAKSKRFFKKSTQRVSLLKHMNEMKKKCHQMKLKSRLLWYLLMKKEFMLVKKAPTMVNWSRFLYKSNKPRLSETEYPTLPNHDTGKVPLDESQRNTIDLLVVVSDSSATDYDSVDESSICNAPLPLLEKLAGAETVFGPKTIKSILKSKFTFKTETLKGVIVNEPSSPPAKDNISTSVSKINSVHAGKLKNVKMEDDPPLAIVNQHHTGQGESSSRSRPSRPALSFHSCIHYGKREALQAKKAESFKTSKTNSSSALRSKTPTKRSDTQFSTCLCARYQENPMESHLIDVKRIFRYLKGKALENSKVSFSIPTGGIYVKVRVNTFRNAIGAHYLPSQTTCWPYALQLSQWASSIARQDKEEEASRTIKLEDLAKVVSHVQSRFKDLDSPEDDLIIVVDDSDEDKEVNKDEVYTTANAKTKDASVHESSSPNSSQIQELTNQLNELLVKSLQTEFLKILSTRDFSSSLSTELKELSFKFNDLTEEVKGLKKQVHELEIELPGDLKEIPTKLEDFTKTAKLKTLVALLSLLNKVTDALNQFAQKDKGKKVMSSEEVEKDSTSSDSDNDETHVTGSIVESSRIKKVKKFDFVTEGVEY
nr:hypothetical protein [Tanacetum cinerariifolium]